MSWRTSGCDILEKQKDEIADASLSKTRNTPKIVNRTYYIRVVFILLEEPVFDYAVYFTENRSVQTLADEQRRSRENWDNALEDVDLPPDVD